MKDVVKEFIACDNASAVNSFIYNNGILFNGVDYNSFAKEKGAYFSSIALQAGVERVFSKAYDVSDDKDVFNALLRKMQGKDILLLYSALVQNKDASITKAITSLRSALLRSDVFDVVSGVFDLGGLSAGQKSFLKYYMPLTYSPMVGALLKALEAMYEDDRNKALGAAVSALYFDDSSKYEKSLYQVVKHLDGGVFKILDTGDLSTAYKQMQERLDYTK